MPSPSSRIDLHAHTVVSDGTLSPTDLVMLASKAGLAALAVTDHDHVGGIAEARVAGERFGVEIVSGIELSVQHDAGELHLLGYFVDEHDADLLGALERMRTQRDTRNERVVERLAALGMPLDIVEIARDAKGSIGRPHIARALLRAGHVGSIQEAFERYLGEGRTAFVPRARILPSEGIALVHAAGGVCSLAHPGLVKAEDERERVVRELASAGLDAVEVRHPKNEPAVRTQLEALAVELGLGVSGGSDFHGENKPDVTLGCEDVRYTTLEALRQRRG